MEWKVDDWHAGEGTRALQDRLNRLAADGWQIFELIRSADALVIAACRPTANDSPDDDGAVAIPLSTREMLLRAAAA